jgi:hypothetical protein
VDQHAGLVTRVMRGSSELQRPPITAGDAPRDLLERLRADGTPVLTVQWGPSRWGFSTDSGRPVTGALADLVEAVHEADAGHGRGRWLYLRIDVTGPEPTVDPVYDHVPTWWQVPYTLVNLALLREELAARSGEWRPDWAALLDKSLADSGVPRHMCVVTESH